MNNYIQANLWDVITHACPDFNGSLAKPLLYFESDLFQGAINNNQAFVQFDMEQVTSHYLN